MKKVLLGCGGFLLLVVGFVAVMLWYGSREFKPVVSRILERCDAGELQQVYEEATEGFRQKWSPSEYQEYMKYRRKVLGRFLAPGTVTQTSRQVDMARSTAEVELGLRYEKGETRGRFEFVDREGSWALRDLVIEVPEELAPAPETEALEPAARRFIELYNEGRRVVLYEGFAAELKEALPAPEFERQMDALSRQMGRVTEATLQSSTRDEEGYHHLRFAVQFEGGPGMATFKFYWRKGRWDLLGFELRPAG